MFRLAFGEPEHAAELLRGALPEALVRAIDWESLQRQDGSFVDAGLRGQQADLLFEAQLAGEPVLLYLLVEHKSGEDRFTAFQLLRYVVRVLERWRREHPDARELPAVVPFVLHHGKRPWRGPRRVRELVRVGGLPADARRVLLALQPDLGFVLDDLATADEADIRARMLSAVATVPLLFLRVLPRCGLAEILDAMTRWHELLVALLAHPDPGDLLGALYCYLLATANADPDALRKALENTLPDTLEAAMTNNLEKLLQRSEQHGRAEGQAEGRAEGQAALLLRLLDRRFGTLPESAIARVRAGTETDLETWAERVLTASTLDEVLGD